MTGIEQGKFQLNVIVSENAILSNFGIQYVAYVDNSDFPLFRNGVVQISDDS